MRERPAQDYKAHLEDSVASGGSGDALELFGDSLRVKRSLKKLYISQERLEQIRKSTGFEWFFWGISLLLILFSFISVLRFFSTRFFDQFPIKLALVSLPFSPSLSIFSPLAKGSPHIVSGQHIFTSPQHEHTAGTHLQ